MSKKNHSTWKSDMGLQVTLGSLSHVGMLRENNQDRCSAQLAPYAPLGADAILSVADGMGGHRAGDVASEMAIKELVDHLNGTRDDNTLPQTEVLRTRLEDAVRHANAAVFEAGRQPELLGMGTTLTVVLIVGTEVILAHVGDSRAYMIRDGHPIQLSKDHSWVAEQLAAGIITSEEADNHPYRNVLTRALGVGAGVEVDSYVTDLGEGDALLLCSDGLHNLVNDREIAQIVGEKDPQEASNALVELANSRGGHDNITVVIGRLSQSGKAGNSERQKRTTTDQTTLISSRGEGHSRSGRPVLVSWLLAPFRLILWPLRKVFSVLLYPLRRGRQK